MHQKVVEQTQRERELLELVEALKQKVAVLEDSKIKRNILAPERKYEY